MGALGATVLLAACGSGARQDANEPSGRFPVDIRAATFPGSQRLSEHTQLVISVRNSGSKTIPDIAVTILNPKDGTAAQAFSQDVASSPGEDLASHSRPVWIIDKPPGPCLYSCRQGGPGSAVTAYSNTWALGALAPGKTATFSWGVTAVQPGHYNVKYQIVAGLNGKAKAVDAAGAQPSGTFAVTIHQAPQQAYVNNAGQIVTKP
ncbi:MAG TPA: hypothetical protein VG223_10455 [Solirubrobacteraceae bacterium]|nr:hypothetical protein [Solirubrobacteraceae bacterium]